MTQSNITKLQSSGQTLELARVIGKGINKVPNGLLVGDIVQKVHRTIERIEKQGDPKWQMQQLFDYVEGYAIGMKAWSAIREYIDLACVDFVGADDTTAKPDHANNGKKTWSNNGNYHRMYDGVAYERVTRAVMHDMGLLRKDEAYYDVMDAVTSAVLRASHGYVIVKEVAVICDLVVRYGLSVNALTEIVQYIARFKVSQ